MLGQPDAGLRPGALDVARPYLAAAYDQVQIGGRLASLRARLLASTDACPYFGFGEPRHLHHYLPRSGYGVLAIYPNTIVHSSMLFTHAQPHLVPGLGRAPGTGGETR